MADPVEVAPPEGAPEGTPADPGTEGGTGAPEEVFALPENFADTVKGWELEDLTQADEYVKLGKALQTEEGVIDGFIGLGQRLGLGIKELEKLFSEEEPAAPPAAPATPETPEDPDRLLTYAEVQELLAKQVIEPQRAAQEEAAKREFEGKRKVAFDAIDTWFEANKISEEERQVVASFGDKLFDKNADPYDPKAVVAALERGKAQYDAVLEKQAAAYIAKKAAAGEKLPVHLGGGAPPGGEPEEKPDYAEAGQKQNAMTLARDRVRAKLKAAGELE